MNKNKKPKPNKHDELRCLLDTINDRLKEILFWVKKKPSPEGDLMHFGWNVAITKKAEVHDEQQN